MVTLLHCEAAVAKVRYANLQRAMALSMDSDLAVFLRDGFAQYDVNGSGQLPLETIKDVMNGLPNQLPMLSQLQLCR